MNFFDDLEALVRAQDPSSSNAAEVFTKLGVPSTSVAILDHGSISARSFSTVGDKEETAFQACSVSKPVAGLAAMRLVQNGKLRLDAPITEYLSPSSINMIATPRTRDLLNHVTIKHLLSHTSGLSLHGFPGYVDSPADLDSVLAGNPPANTLQVCLEGLPGHTFSYSGGGISVLQLIMEKVIGSSFPDIVNDLVFEPLGMQRSFYRSPTDEDDHANAYWTGSTACKVSYHVFPEQAAVGLWTTPTDLLKAVRAVQHSLTAEDGSGFLTQDQAKLMLTEVSSGMALSWFATKDPRIVFSHPGANDPGWRSFVIGYADLNGNGALDARSQDSGLCIMTNSAVGDFVYSKLIPAITYLKGWMDLPNSPYIPEAIVPFCTQDKRVDATWIEWSGVWDNKWRIEEHHSAPCLFFESLPPLRLLPAARPRPNVCSRNPIDLVLEGLDMMLRLTEEHGEKLVQVWHGANGDSTTLHRPGEAIS